jgi:Uri superfamily endonuclease
VAWTEVEEETQIAQHLSEACMKNWKAADKLGASDAENNSEVVITKLNEMLENVNEVMT